MAAAGSDCNILKQYFAPPPWYTEFYIGLIAAVVLAAGGFAAYAWRNGAWGRYFWNKKGIKAVMTFRGAPGVIGMLTPFLDKMFLFTSSGSDKKKNKIQRLIPAVPGAVTHLRQEDGGDSFCLVQGDKGLPVSPSLMEWAAKNLNTLSKTKNWNQFALKTKLDLLNRSMAMAKLFPEVTDWNPGTQIVNLEMADGNIVQKPAKECSAEEKTWYIKMSKVAGETLTALEEQTSKTKAMLNGEKFYTKGQVKVELPPRQKTEWVDIITNEIKNMGGEVGEALKGASAVTSQYVADVLSNVPNGVYFDSAHAVLKEKWEKEKRRDFNAQMQTILIILVFLGGLGFIVYVFSHNGI